MRLASRQTGSYVSPAIYICGEHVARAGILARFCGLVDAVVLAEKA